MKFKSKTSSNNYNLYNESSNLMLVNNSSFSYNSLFRTSMGSITYNCYELRTGVLRSFKEKIKNDNIFYQASSYHPSKYEEQTVNKHDVTAAIASMIINKDKNLIKIAENLRYKLSSNGTNTMGSIMYTWIKNLVISNRLFDITFHILLLLKYTLGLSFVKLYNKIIYYCSGLDSNLDNHCKQSNFSTKSTLTHAWQLYFMPNTKMKEIIQHIFLKHYGNDNNLLLKLLCGQDVSYKEITDYKPMTKWRWNTNINYCKSCRKLTKEESAENTIDKDILYKMKVLNSNKSIYFFTEKNF